MYTEIYFKRLAQTIVEMHMQTLQGRPADCTAWEESQLQSKGWLLTEFLCVWRGDGVGVVSVCSILTFN